jgi:isoquinoline 1-oxidoreductase alpha subunit
MISFQLNGKPVALDIDPETPLLWVVREHLNMTSTKFGCGLGLCGACTMHLNGAAVRSCIIPLSAVQGGKVTSIEGLSDVGMHAVQQAWVEAAVPQCGYCQPGQMMQAASLLAQNRNPSDAQIDEAMAGNICRCGTYPRIRIAIKNAVAMLPK